MSELVSPEPIDVEDRLIDRSDRIRVEVSGPDRAKFLHNLTTNDIKRLAVGRGCEAFVTSTQGKTIGYLTILAYEEQILLRTDPRGLELAGPHFGKYGIFEDVTIDDRTAATFEVHLFGSESEKRLHELGCRLPEFLDYAHMAADLNACPVRIVRESPSGLPGFTVIGDRRDSETIFQSLEKAGFQAKPLGEIRLIFDFLRIRAGTPVFGKDITEKNLPQEIGRDARAISFVKGCYLGQETVARIDALGHVNQVLKGLFFAPRFSCPAPGSTLESDGKKIGVITSSVLSPDQRGALALAMIKTSHAAPGTALAVITNDSSQLIKATVSDLPFAVRI